MKKSESSTPTYLERTTMTISLYFDAKEDIGVSLTYIYGFRLSWESPTLLKMKKN